MRDSRGIYFFLMLLLACGTKDHGVEENSLFSLMSPDQTNINFTNQLQDSGDLDIIEYLYYYNGGGVAIGDINNDGLDDMFFTANQGANQLYLNLGEFKFKDITEEAGVKIKGKWSTGVTMADVNNDGYLDIYVCELGDYKGIKGSNKLFLNNGNLTFSEKGRQYGLDFSGFSTQAAFFDKDLDGDLDLYILNNSVHSVNNYGKAAQLRNLEDSLAGDRLYENNLSETGRFNDVTKRSGIYSSAIGYGLGLGVADINTDGYPDIYVSNDFHENDYLYINRGDGTFSEELYKHMAHTSRYSMGNDIGDINNDGEPDIITVDMLPADPEILLKSVGEDKQEVFDVKTSYGYDVQYVRNALQISTGGRFSEIAQYLGIHATDWSWAPLMADFDGDGLKDIFITNGIYKRPNDLNFIQYLANLGRNNIKNQDSLSKEMIRRMPTLKIPNYLFRNFGDHQFINVSKEWGLDEPTYSNGAAYADLDNDGDLDIIINNLNQPAFIYRNNSDKELNHNHFIKIALRGSSHNYFGIGAKVDIFHNGKVQTKQLQTTRGFQSSVPPYLYFGLGKDQRIDSIRITWSRKNVQVLESINADQTLEIVEQQGKEFSKIIIDEIESIALPYKHRENVNYQDHKYEFLLPYRLSREGPAAAVGDINKDDQDDIYLGGARDQKSVFFLQQPDGSFQSFVPEIIAADSTYEDVDAVFFDANSDGYQDLYVVSGGGDAGDGDASLQDRLYLQNKNGWIKQPLPQVASNGSCVKVADIDNDGDRDLFVGTRSIPGGYGIPARQYILINDGQGSFSDETRALAPELMELGMITDAQWADIDNDNDQDLITAGDWEPVHIFINENNKIVKKTEEYDLEELTGWWRSIEIADINNDGFKDILVGNFGMNNKLKPTPETPLTLYIADFDNNGRPEPILFYYLNGQMIPVESKDDLAGQMPMINRIFTDYSSFSKVRSLDALMGSGNADYFLKKDVKVFESGILLSNAGRSFDWKPFPAKAQWSVINSILVTKEGEIIAGGNTTANFVEIGDQDAFPGLLKINPAEGADSGFQNLNYRFIKKLLQVNLKGEKFVLTISNNDSVRLYPENALKF